MCRKKGIAIRGPLSGKLTCPFSFENEDDGYTVLTPKFLANKIFGSRLHLRQGKLKAGPFMNGDIEKPHNVLGTDTWEGR